MADFNENILLIGAGVAGIYAGYLLQRHGIEFQILEASDRVGGRLGKLEGFADYPLDLGAEWLHGKKSLMGKLVKRTQTAITQDKSKERYWFRNKLKKKTPIDVWDFFEQEDLPDISYRDYATQEGLGEEYRYIVEGVAGDFGASAANISAYWKIKEEEAWNSGNKDYKFARTYFDLVYEHLAVPVLDKIRLQSIVSRIDYSGEQIVVEDSEENLYFADKVLLTVPITILKEGDIEFVPPLPEEKVSAFQQIGMEAGMKVFLKFSEKFFHPGIYGGKYCAAYADEIIGKLGKDHVLLAYIMGEQAAYLSALREEAMIVSILLEELDEMYAGKATPAFLDAHVVDWMAHPFIRGAYSYSTVGMGNARSIAAQPVASKLFFAGEAMNLNGHHQTVQGATETARREVGRMLNQDVGKFL